MQTEYHIKVEAPRTELLGATCTIDGWPVVYVRLADKPKIKYNKYTSDYKQRSDRPWKINKRSFSKLANALRYLSTLE